MSDVTLSASVRQSLLSLQSTTNLIERTQNRLSTGLRVSDAIDDPVAFFQAKSLSDRSSDFLEKKDAIDQGISTVTAALDGVEAIENLVNQLKGVSNSMKSATDAQIADLVTQFNDLRTQINNLATDASYQGTNLINGTGQTLSIEFSEQTASLLTINSVDITVGTAGLNIAANSYITGDSTLNVATLGAITAGSNTFSNRFISTTSDFSLTYLGSDVTFNAGETVSFTYGTGSTFNFVVSTAAALTLTQNEAITVNVASSTTAATAGQFALLATQTVNALFNYSAQTVAYVDTATDDTVTLTYNGTSTVTLTTADDNSVFFTLVSTAGTAVDSVALQFRTGVSLTLTQGATFTLGVQGLSAASNGASTQNVFIEFTNTSASISLGNGGTAATGADTAVYGIAVNGGATGTNIFTANGGELTFTGLVQAGDTTRINQVIDQLDTALTTLRTQAQTLGSNVALLNTRLSFTEQYTNTLQGGADKLTLADINEEGANLLALQTRQQLGIQSLSLAAQAEASILSLFG